MVYRHAAIDRSCWHERRRDALAEVAYVAGSECSVGAVELGVVVRDRDVGFEDQAAVDLLEIIWDLVNDKVDAIGYEVCNVVSECSE